MREILPGTLCKFLNTCIVCAEDSNGEEFLLSNDGILLYLYSELGLRYRHYFLDNKGIKIMIPSHLSLERCRDKAFLVELS
jgi:hypothetical protein